METKEALKTFIREKLSTLNKKELASLFVEELDNIFNITPKKSQKMKLITNTLRVVKQEKKRKRKS